MGYAKAPRASRFKPGQSGNPRGRPRRGRAELPYAVLDEIVTITDHGQSRKVTAEEALLLKISQSGLAGDVAAAQIILEGRAAARLARGDDEEPQQPVEIVGVSPDNADEELCDLGMVAKMDRYRSTVYLLIEPWLAQAALDRADYRAFTPAEQAAVFKATRKPWQVVWPDGWVGT